MTERKLVDCKQCGGSGEVHEVGYSLNPYTGLRSPDPQCQRDYPCPRCHGEGVEPEPEG
jgi:DnaJ-class molecular chaperone